MSAPQWMMDELHQFERVMLEYIGIISGIFDALAENALTVPQLAELIGSTREVLLQAYCETAQAYGLLALTNGRYHASDRVLSHITNLSIASYSYSYIFRGMWAYILALFPSVLKGGEVQKDPWVRNLCSYGSGIAARQHSLPLLMDAIDLSKPLSILDIGCGDAAFLIEVVGLNSRSRGVGVEIDPEVAEAAGRTVREFGMQDRVDIECQNIHDCDFELPFNLIIMNSVLHYMNEDDCKGLIAQAYSWLCPGGSIAVLEQCYLHGDQLNARPWLGIMNMVFMVYAGTRLHKASQIEKHLAGAGFRQIGIISVDSKGTSTYFLAVK